MALSQERTFLVAGEGEEIARQLRSLIESPDPDAWRTASKRITGIFDAYLEQPCLLDPHLPGIVSPIMQHVRRTLRAWHAARVDERETAEAAGIGSAFAFQVLHDPHLNALLAVVYHACKTRGFKHVVKLMPHEVADLEPAVQALCCQDSSDHASWETRYVLLLWLSILALVPFDLASIDSGGGSGGGLIASLVAVCKAFLADPGPVRSVWSRRGLHRNTSTSRPPRRRCGLRPRCASRASSLGRTWSGVRASLGASWSGLSALWPCALRQLLRQPGGLLVARGRMRRHPPARRPSLPPLQQQRRLRSTGPRSMMGREEGQRRQRRHAVS